MNPENRQIDRDWLVGHEKNMEDDVDKRVVAMRRTLLPRSAFQTSASLRGWQISFFIGTWLMRLTKLDLGCFRPYGKRDSIPS